MTAMRFADLVMDYIMPAGLTFIVVYMIYLFVSEEIKAHRRAKREREQQVH